MAHYVKALVDRALEVLDDEEVVFFHRFKKDVERGEYVLNAGTAAEVSARDLLWQEYRNYDQIGHAYLAWLIWVGVVGHPLVKSAAFQVGGCPSNDKAVEWNNGALKMAAGPFKAKFYGGYGEGDGWVIPDKSAGFRSNMVALEVGGVSPGQLIFHLYRDRAFARWPYGSSFVYVFEIPHDGKLFNIQDLVKSHWGLCSECRAKGLGKQVSRKPSRIHIDPGP